MTRGWALLLFGTIVLLTLMGISKDADAHKPGNGEEYSSRWERR